MDRVVEELAAWLKSVLVDGVMSVMVGMFQDVNNHVADITTQVGMTPDAFQPSVFNMIRNLSETVIMPIAGMVLTFIACYELIQLITAHNNLANFETWIFFKWLFKPRVRDRDAPIKTARIRRSRTAEYTPPPARRTRPPP